MSSPFRALSQCLGGYLHQDWDLESKTWQEAMSKYAMQSRPEQVQQAIVELDALFGAEFVDDKLEATVERDLGCAYCPEPDGLTMRAWLAPLRNYLVATQNAI